jgi:hypothetical protein
MLNIYIFFIFTKIQDSHIWPKNMYFKPDPIHPILSPFFGLLSDHCFHGTGVLSIISLGDLQGFSSSMAGGGVDRKSNRSEATEAAPRRAIHQLFLSTINPTL